MLFLAVVFVHALCAELVVTLDGSNEIVNGDVELLSQLFQGICLHQIAVLHQAFISAPYEGIRHVGQSAVGECEQTAAADFIELLAVLLVVGIEYVHIGVVRLHFHGVEHEFVRARFVAETLAVQVDLKERLLAEPEPLAGGLVACCLVGLDAAAVEHHGCMGGIQSSACPHHGLDAGTVGCGAQCILDLHIQSLGLKGLHHVCVGGIAAGADQNALGGIDPDIVSIAVLGNDACDLVTCILLQLDQGGGEAEVNIADFVAVVREEAVDGQSIVIGILVGLVRAVASGIGLVASGIIQIADAAFQAHVILAVLLEDVGQPVDHFAGLVDPYLDQIAVAVACAVADQLLQSFHLVDG